jgi:hypothetical protein
LDTDVGRFYSAFGRVHKHYSETTMSEHFREVHEFTPRRFVVDVNDDVDGVGSDNAATVGSGGDTDADAGDKGVRFVAFHFRGASFVYHQIRKMVAITVAIARRLLPPSTATLLLDGPVATPHLPLAPAGYLVLHESSVQDAWRNSRYYVPSSFEIKNTTTTTTTSDDGDVAQSTTLQPVPVPTATVTAAATKSKYGWSAMPMPKGSYLYTVAAEANANGGGGGGANGRQDVVCSYLPVPSSADADFRAAFLREQIMPAVVGTTRTDEGRAELSDWVEMKLANFAAAMHAPLNESTSLNESTTEATSATATATAAAATVDASSNSSDAAAAGPSRGAVQTADHDGDGGGEADALDVSWNDYTSRPLFPALADAPPPHLPGISRLAFLQRAHDVFQLLARSSRESKVAHRQALKAAKKHDGGGYEKRHKKRRAPSNRRSFRYHN